MDKNKDGFHLDKSNLPGSSQSDPVSTQESSRLKDEDFKVHVDDTGENMVDEIKGYEGIGEDVPMDTFSKKGDVNEAVHSSHKEGDGGTPTDIMAMNPLNDSSAPFSSDNSYIAITTPSDNKLSFESSSHSSSHPQIELPSVADNKTAATFPLDPSETDTRQSQPFDSTYGNSMDSIFSMNMVHMDTCRRIKSVHRTLCLSNDNSLASANSMNKLNIEMLNELSLESLTHFKPSRDTTLTTSTNTKILNESIDADDTVRSSRRRYRYVQVGKGDAANDIWSTFIGKVEPYLDVFSILMIRQTCRLLYSYRYRLRSHGILCFRGFAGFDSNAIFGLILPLVHRVFGLTESSKIRFDFTSCVLIKDISVVRMLTSMGNMTSRLEMREYGRNVRELIFDFCDNLTDKALEVMLTTRLPYLQRLSLVCCRNQKITGVPFMRDLSAYNWPNFTKFRCSFSNIWLEPIQVIADYIIRCANTIRSNQFRRTSSQMFEDKPHKRMDLEQLEICGSWGSRKLLENLGFGVYTSSFANALKNGDVKSCSDLTKKIQHALLDLSSQNVVNKNSCVLLLRNRGSELLVNCPITVNDPTHDVGVWTLPISLAIQNRNMELFHLLVKRGARVNVWDYLGKSPLFISCELDLVDYASTMLKFMRPPNPYDKYQHIPLSISIINQNVELVKLLLKGGVDLNVSCPNIRNYKSPLYIACEINNEVIIRLLLDAGADPNWRYHHKSTPTLLAYQNDPKWLEIFLRYGAGSTPDKRWVLTEVLSCAITRDEIDSISLLVNTYPCLLHGEHDIWSMPHIQASKLGNINILELLSHKIDINTADSYGMTALHAAAEEGNIDCMKLLIGQGADLNRQNRRGRDPLHLACLENRVEAVKLLLKSNCNPNIKEHTNGETPLMSCIKNRNENLAHILLNDAKGMDYELCDHLGRNSLLYSLFFGQTQVSEILMKSCPDSTLTSSKGTTITVQEISKDKHMAIGSDKRLLWRFLNFYKPKKRGNKYSFARIERE